MIKIIWPEVKEETQKHAEKLYTIRMKSRFVKVSQNDFLNAFIGLAALR